MNAGCLGDPGTSMKSMRQASTQGTAPRLCQAFAKRLNNTSGTKLQNRSASQRLPSIGAPHKSTAQPPSSEPSNKTKHKRGQVTHVFRFDTTLTTGPDVPGTSRSCWYCPYR